jgi:hypothetical protein
VREKYCCGGICLHFFSLYGWIDAKAVTKLDRYLMIATSGGLNQQRTGVRGYKLPVTVLVVASIHNQIISDFLAKKSSDI